MVRRDVILLTQLGDKSTLGGRAGRRWRSVKADQQDFVIEIDADDRATVVFGDGKFGAIPPPGPALQLLTV